MDFGSPDDYYSDIFDYYNDARAGMIIFNTFEIFHCNDFTPIESSFSMDSKSFLQVAKMHCPEHFQPTANVRNCGNLVQN